MKLVQYNMCVFQFFNINYINISIFLNLLFINFAFCYIIRESYKNSREHERKDFIIMSQAKVDKYKKDKANRKKIIARQKRVAAFQKFAVAVVSLALVVFIVGSAYFKWFKDDKSDVTENVTYALSEEEVSSVWNSVANSEAEEDSTTAQEEVSDSESPIEENSTES